MGFCDFCFFSSVLFCHLNVIHLTMKLLIFAFIFIRNFACSQNSDANFLLPSTTKPELYAFSISTDVPGVNPQFTGVVSIFIRIVQNTREIFLHSRQHTIIESMLYELPGMESFNVEFERMNDEVVKFSTEEELQAGSLYDLHISYQGNLLLVSDGFFRSDYVVNENGNDVFT